MMWVIFALCLIELVAVHMFVALRWPMIGWPLTIVSAIVAIWMIFWIRSFRRLPHIVDEEGFVLRLGSLKELRIPHAKVDGIAAVWADGATTAKNAINLAGIAYPNRCLELIEPIEKRKQRVFIRLDDPQAFDAAVADYRSLSKT